MLLDGSSSVGSELFKGPWRVGHTNHRDIKLPIGDEQLQRGEDLLGR